MKKKPAQKSFRRARRPEQIQQRKEAILRAAFALFQRKRLENITLNDIAHEAGTAKSNLYRYYESREDIYLHILQREGRTWEARIVPALEKLAGKGTIPKVASIITRAFVDSEWYCLLMSASNSVLEKNLSPKRVANFRSVFFDRRQRFAQVLARSLPNAPFEKIAPLILPMFAEVAGIWPLCHPCPESTSELNKPEFAHLQLDFEVEMRRFVEHILKGALN